MASKAESALGLVLRILLGIGIELTIAFPLVVSYYNVTHPTPQSPSPMFFPSETLWLVVSLLYITVASSANLRTSRKMDYDTTSMETFRSSPANRAGNTSQ
ncbi:MAG TPA: hypothetical protein VJ044_00245 [Candidatus Hodarchaeales archaeon]|nr:hypothetical protein [Candidatus Hodarchaeales archaeon]